MGELPPISLVDASIGVKWLLPFDDEPHADLAEQVFIDSRESRILIFSADHLVIEVGHALRRAVRRERITESQGRELLDRFASWDVAGYTEDLDIKRAWELSGGLGCSYYDAIYLAISERTNWPFLHADRKLRTQLNGRFHWERWIEDYPVAR